MAESPSFSKIDPPGPHSKWDGKGHFRDVGREGVAWLSITLESNGDEVSGLPVYSMDSGKTSCGPQKNTTIDTTKGGSQFERG